MSGLAMPDIDLDLTVLEELDKDLTPKCDGEGCNRDATHTITCPCGKGTEFSCMPCIESMKDGGKVELNGKVILDLGGGIILFDPTKSCGHRAKIDDCAINPL
jgi:hypothetical protein